MDGSPAGGDLVTRHEYDAMDREVKTWLPEGIWYDIYTGMIYDGNRILDMYRDLNSIPVLAKAGAIIPLTEEISANEAQENPNSFVLNVFAGADGNFTMYEDDNKTRDFEKCVRMIDGKTKHSDKTFTLTNLSDFEYVFE